MANPILVLAEIRDGRLNRASCETVGAGRKLASARGGRLGVVLVGPGASALAKDVAAYGADDVYTVEGAAFASYASEAWRDAVLAAVQAASPEVVLMPASSLGLDVAPRVAARLGTALLTDVVELGFAGDGTLEARRPVYAGKAYATARAAGAKPAVATLRPNAFPAPPPENGRAHEVKKLEVTPAKVRARVTGFAAAKGTTVDVAEADRVVAGGRGLKGPENFALLEALAKELGAAVGASRAVVDAGWIGHDQQVGQTGKTVAPVLYVAVGISGAIQHLAGMSTSKVIVAINKDPEAPIFKAATYGIVGDLFEVVPAFTEEIKRHKAAKG